MISALPTNGMVHLSSPYPVSETLGRVKTLLQARSLPLVAEINHSAAAAEVGLKMQPAILLIFGNPKSGTPLMIASPTLAIDLPLKGLVWEDAEGETWLSYNSPEYLKQRHDVPDKLLANISGIRAIFEEAVR